MSRREYVPDGAAAVSFTHGDVEGWKAVAAHIRRSMATAIRWAKRDEDPLPVYRLGDHVHAYSEELDAWLSRNVRLISDEPRQPVSNHGTREQ